MKKYLLVTVVGLYSALGCSAAPLDGSEDLGTVSQAYGADQCRTASAVQTFTSRWGFTSSTSYGTGCNAIDVTSLTTANADNTITYTGTLPTNATDCANTFILADLYGSVGGVWSIIEETQSTGFWAGSSCTVPSISFGRLAPSVPYRIAATARTYVGSSFTARQFTVFTSVIR